MNDDLKQLKEAEKMMGENVESAPDMIASDSQSPAKNNNWMIGIVFILVGGGFLLANLTDIHLNNWWAFFILLPAFGGFNRACSAYRQEGMNEEARNGIITGMLMVTVALFFLFNLSWGTFWPILLIIIGIGSLLTLLAR